MAISKAVFECPKGDGGLHRWAIFKDGPVAARCENCGLEVDEDEAARYVFGRGDDFDETEDEDLRYGKLPPL